MQDDGLPMFIMSIFVHGWGQGKTGGEAMDGTLQSEWVTPTTRKQGFTSASI